MRSQATAPALLFAQYSDDDFVDLQLLLIFVAGRHRGGRSGEHLVVIDVQEPQPALLAEREADHAAELDQLRLAEVAVQAIPEGIIGVEMPGDRLGIGERRFLPLVVCASTSRN